MGKVPQPMSCGSWNIKSFCQKGEISGREGEYLPDGNVVLEFSRTVQETQGPFSPSSTSADTRSPCYLLIRARCLFLEKRGLILGALDWYRLSLEFIRLLINWYWSRGNVSLGWIFCWYFGFLHLTLREKTHIIWYLCSHKPPAYWTRSLIKVTNLELVKMNQLTELSAFSPNFT